MKHRCLKLTWTKRLKTNIMVCPIRSSIRTNQLHVGVQLVNPCGVAKNMTSKIYFKLVSSGERTLQLVGGIHHVLAYVTHHHAARLLGEYRRTYETSPNSTWIQNRVQLHAQRFRRTRVLRFSFGIVCDILGHLHAHLCCNL